MNSKKDYEFYWDRFGYVADLRGRATYPYSARL